MTKKKLTTPRVWRDQLERTHAVRQTTDDEQEMEDASDRFWKTIKSITKHRATTPEAFAVKARALRMVFLEDLKGSSSDVKLWRSLLDDLDPDGAESAP